MYEQTIVQNILALVDEHVEASQETPCEAFNVWTVEQLETLEATALSAVASENHEVREKATRLLEQIDEAYKHV